ncbi:MAG: aldehyde dehydrogenase family protein [Ignavibacteriales bacterium]|nr:aldehyde dehydrogenase family protein [Ignavibacteriales bacterium]
MSTAPNRFYVGGEWRFSDANTANIVNPYNGSVVGSVSLASDADAEEAIQKGLTGFQKTRALQSYQRFEILTFISQRIKESREEFAQRITAEVGKPIQFSRVEVDRAIITFQLAAEEAKRIVGEVVPLDIASNAENRFGIVRRFPLGIVLGIAPFNFPLNLVAHKLAPAIASGNAFILKPPPQAPLTSLKLAEIVDASGFPKEAFSVLPCSNELAEKLVLDSRIKMLSFTGSANVGWYLKSKAGKKKVLLELGGNAGLIIDKGINVDETVKRNAIASFANAGQVCIKVQRVYIHHDIYEEYERKFIEATKAIKVGDPSDSATIVGPMIDEAAATRVSGWIEEAKTKGAKILTGGAQKGRIIEPTVLINVDREAKVFCNEVFGPVVTLHKVQSVEEAVEGINDSPFGLQAGIFSNDFKNIMHAYNHLDVGAVIVNDNPTFRVDNMPYGGIKDSGFGREGVRYAIDEMTEPKQLVVS